MTDEDLQPIDAKATVSAGRVITVETGTEGATVTVTLDGGAFGDDVWTILAALPSIVEQALSSLTALEEADSD